MSSPTSEASGAPAFERMIDGLRYRTARPDERDGIWNLMLEEFYPNTPLNQHIGGITPADVSVDFALNPGLLEQGVTLVAEDPAEPAAGLLGARVSCVVPRSEAKRHPLVADPQLAAQYPKDAAVYRVIDCLLAPVDLYSHYSVDTVIDFKYLVVRRASRSRNIARRLVECSVELARLRGIPVVNVVAAHRHAGRIFEALGFDRLNSVELAAYVDEADGGSRPFEQLDPAVLQEIALFAKRVD